LGFVGSPPFLDDEEAKSRADTKRALTNMDENYNTFGQLLKSLRQSGIAIPATSIHSCVRASKSEIASS